jgi:hypothetical protein
MVPVIMTAQRGCVAVGVVQTTLNDSKVDISGMMELLFVFTEL